MEFQENSKTYHSPMHTAEHILNQTMDRMFGCGRSFNSHIERKKSKCDYRINRPLSPEEITAIETRVNEIIKSNAEVTEEFVSLEEARTNFNTSKLPGDAGNTIRIIKVGDYDVCPCSGMHVKNTSEIPEFQIASASFENNAVRLRFKLKSENQ
jgi:misacylated tRNA(Ala) deacylase